MADTQGGNDLLARIEELERRLDRHEAKGRESRGTGMEAAFWSLMHSVFPDDARRHMKAAGREQLLAARTYIDRWIAKAEQKPEAEQGTPHESIPLD
jgi:hypothetical protein